MEEEDDFFGGVLKIALGIFLGTMLVWIAVELRARYELAELNRSVQISAEQLGQQAFEAEERRAKRDRDIRALQNAQSMKAQRMQAERVATERAKEKAWASFYHPSAECQASTSIECGNQYIRARREFERKYASGQML
jgi:hypothetical protein